MRRFCQVSCQTLNQICRFTICKTSRIDFFLSHRRLTAIEADTFAYPITSKRGDREHDFERHFELSQVH
jgi:hypothetical protein